MCVGKRATKALSYNVQEVKGDELTAVKDANFMNSLSGKVAGVQINSGATGAGGATRVVMRGMKSLTKDNNALYVIDGVPIFNTGKSGGEGLFGEMGGSDAVADLNPDDIASISMMTGPSAAALYGSAAANGVVLITTKKGQTEKTTITVSNSTTFETPAEYKLFHILGADAVGMSTVPEVIVANHCGIKVFGISVITDLGVEGKIVEVTHEEVQKAADAAQPKMTTIMRELINRA